MRLVIGCVNNRRTPGLKPVTKSQRWIIQVAGADCDVFNSKGSFDELVVPDLSAELVQLNRKVGICICPSSASRSDWLMPFGA